MSDLDDFAEEFPINYGVRERYILGTCRHVLDTGKRCKMRASHEVEDGRAYCRHHIPVEVY